MKFYKLDQVPSSREDKVFRVSPAGKAIGALVLLGIAIAALPPASMGISLAA